ncbi:uncharacterized, partial [Tachysurus ichikawai]
LCGEGRIRAQDLKPACREALSVTSSCEQTRSLGSEPQHHHFTDNKQGFVLTRATAHTSTYRRSSEQKLRTHLEQRPLSTLSPL